MADHPDNAPRFGERAEFGPGDVCYRHPSEPTFTLCQRCGNNICPECQTASAVGVLCPDCVKAATPGASTRAKRRFTATSRALGDSSTTVVTYVIMAVCAAVFAGQMLNSEVTYTLWYAPVYSHPEVFEPWRMITSMFTHSTSGLLHILFNMYALWLFGRELERMLGRGLFISLYLLAGLGGSVFVMLWGYTSIDEFRTPVVGASGAIFGVLGATLIALKSANVNITSLAVLIAINFAIGFWPGANISWQGHAGGFIVGVITMLVLLRLRGPRKRGARIAALIGITVMLLVLSSMFFIIDPVPLFSR